MLITLLKGLKDSRSFVGQDVAYKQRIYEFFLLGVGM